MEHLVPYTPQQNGVAERKDMVLKEMVTYMIEAKDLSPKLWAEAINCVAYIHNIYLHKSVSGKTPYEHWFGHKPNISHIIIFGLRAWARIPSKKRKALQTQRKECIMVRYGEYTKGYKLFDSSTQNTFIERSVQFEEEIILDVELAPRACSSPQHQDDVSDDSIYDISDSDMAEYDVSEHDSPTRPKWEEKPI